MDVFPTEEVESPEQKPFFMLLLLLIGMFLGSMAVSALLLAIYDGDIDQWVALQASLSGGSTYGDRMWVRWVNFFNQFLTFTLPALATLWVVFRSQWIPQADLDRAPRAGNVAIGVLWIGLAFLGAQFIFTLNQKLPLPEWMSEMEQQTEGMVQALLVMDRPTELMLNLLVIGLLPAIGEELVFRGIVQKQLQVAFGRPHLAIWLSAAIFSAIHFQFEGFLPRMLLGGVLGYLYYWSGNLWLPMLAHLFNNALQVLAWYFLADQLGSAGEMAEQQVGWTVGVPALIALVALGYYIRNRFQAPTLSDIAAP